MKRKSYLKVFEEGQDGSKELLEINTTRNEEMQKTGFRIRFREASLHVRGNLKRTENKPNVLKLFRRMT